MPKCRKFRDKQMVQILIAKSGISNHTAAGICYDPCLSKFGALHGVCPNVEETRNGMPAAIWKKYTNFASKNLRHLFIPELSTICFLSSKQDFYDMLFFCIQLFDPFLFYPHGICCPRFRFQLLFIAEDTFYPLFFTLALFRI